MAWPAEESQPGDFRNPRVKIPSRFHAIQPGGPRLFLNAVEAFKKHGRFLARKDPRRLGLERNPRELEGLNDPDRQQDRTQCEQERDRFALQRDAQEKQHGPDRGQQQKPEQNGREAQRDQQRRFNAQPPGFSGVPPLDALDQRFEVSREPHSSRAASPLHLSARSTR